MGYDSIRPDLKYVRSGGREGTSMGCGDAGCWCGGGPGERRETARRRGRYRAPASSEDGEDRPSKDPRYAWPPP
jgi:hypothetical protein